MQNGAAIVSDRLRHRPSRQRQAARLFDDQGGIHAFVRSLATHLIDKGIRVNAVAPGPVWTPLNPADKDAAYVIAIRQRYADEASGTAGGNRTGFCVPRRAELFELHNRRDLADHRRLFGWVK